MWPSTLPTGTVRNKRHGSRTFPEQPAPQNLQQPGQQLPDPEVNDSESKAELRDTISTLRRKQQQAAAEIRQLESQVDQLQLELGERKLSQQSVVDQYERVVAELESAVTTAQQGTTAEGDGAPDRRTAERGPSGCGIYHRLRQRLF